MWGVKTDIQCSNAFNKSESVVIRPCVGQWGYSLSEGDLGLEVVRSVQCVQPFAINMRSLEVFIWSVKTDMRYSNTFSKSGSAGICPYVCHCGQGLFKEDQGFYKWSLLIISVYNLSASNLGGTNDNTVIYKYAWGYLRRLGPKI